MPGTAPARPIIPDRITWLNAEMIKTRLGTGYCARHYAAEPCDYANICETCDNFTRAPEFAPWPTNSPTPEPYTQTPSSEAGPTTRNAANA